MQFLEYLDNVSWPVPNTTTTAAANTTLEVWEVPVKSAAYVVLLALSAALSGLLLGLLTLDPLTLEFIIKANPGTTKAKQAAMILPHRLDGNLLLCSLCLCNVAVNSLIPVLLDEIIGIASVSFVVTTFTVVLLGEILPQVRR